MTNKILAGCAALLLTASLHAQNTANHTTSPFTGTTTNPCTGQPINFFGSCQHMSQQQTEKDGGTRTRVHSVCEAHGITPTGTIHRYMLNTKHDVETEACGVDSYERETVKVISFGKQPNYFLDALVRFRINEFCQPEVTVIETDSDCRGAGQN